MTDKKNKILCMCSGGLASLGALYRLLTEEAYAGFDLHVHHINLRNIENRMQAERRAVQKTLSYFREGGFRHLFFTESFHDCSFMRQFQIPEPYWYGFMAAHIITADSSILYVATGRNRSDREGEAAARKSITARRGLEIFHATLPLELRFERHYIYPVADLTKKAIWALLPEELRNMVWTCDRPVTRGEEILPCGQCAQCAAFQEIAAEE
ncbi:MAG: hypothetical protein ACLFPD_04300 [Desulfosudaceae bacterium]